MLLIIKLLQAYKLIKKGCFLYQFFAVSLHCESKAKSCFDGYYKVLNTYFSLKAGAPALVWGCKTT